MENVTERYCSEPSGHGRLIDVTSTLVSKGMQCSLDNCKTSHLFVKEEALYQHLKGVHSMTYAQRIRALPYRQE